jgi:hypothetical protein
LVASLQRKADHADEEIVIVSSDILRRFPSEFDSILAICDALEWLKHFIE